LFSCQPNTGSQGNVIIFGDVVGSYIGQCADYSNSTSELMNREDATLSVFAIYPDNASINPSCGRIEKQEVRVLSASASEIIFEKNISENSIIRLKYLSASDSIVLTMTDINNNVIFSGVRN